LEEFAREVEVGLTASPKRLPCRYFYDGQGSLLFEEICALPEYYLTRTERQILQEHAGEIASLFDEEIALVDAVSAADIKRVAIQLLGEPLQMSVVGPFARDGAFRLAIGA